MLRSRATTFIRHSPAIKRGMQQRVPKVARSSSSTAPTDTFLRRHVGPSAADSQEMLSTLGFASFAELSDSTVPAAIRSAKPLDLPDAQSESEALASLREIASKNRVHKSGIGQGYHGTLTPAVILRNMVENPGWYTAYTPYQAELSQGRMEMLLNFQTAMADLTGMSVSNASLLDEATAAAEAMTMSHRAHRGKRSKYFVDASVHPQTLDVLRTRAEPIGIEIVVGRAEEFAFSDDSCDVCGVLVQYPDTQGEARDFSDIASRAKRAKVLVTAAADPLSLTLLRPPGEWGADFCVGSAQRFGVPMFFGGPHAGFLTLKDEKKYLRQMPGRVIGVSKDARGQSALRMALATREQHIRRDKATSNICTAQALLANVAAAYCVYHGPDGLKQIAEKVRTLACGIASGLGRPSEALFDTVTIDVSDVDGTVARVLKETGINIRKLDSARVSVSVDETWSLEDAQAVTRALGGECSNDDDAAEIASALRRTSDYLTHPVFNTHRSETHMLRYLKRLESKDIALNHSMIPLGSCTMKLNAVSEMIPVTWPEFANMHPFAPADQTEGYRELCETLSEYLAEITGFAAISHQPNSGASGEYAGLLAIRGFLSERDGASGKRDVCLIPASAHGTNPASAVMAGMRVVVVKNIAETGEIDMEDLKAKAKKHGDELAALMITYPSTYGVFEEGVREAIDLVHDLGGQVYMDGANMNAQVGLCR